MLQLMKNNSAEGLGRQQTCEKKENISLTEKHLDELQELKDHTQESMLEEQQDMEKVKNWSKELENKLFSYKEIKTGMTTLLVSVV